MSIAIKHRLKKILNVLGFPVLLVCACCLVHAWQRSMVDLILPFLPNNAVLPLALMTPALLGVTFLATYVMLKQSDAPRPVLNSIISAAAMLVLVLLAAVHFLSYAASRYAGVLPVIILPEMPGGKVMMTITGLFVAHLTALLICRFVKEKAKPIRIVLSTVGWIFLNVCLWLVTT